MHRRFMTWLRWKLSTPMRSRTSPHRTGQTWIGLESLETRRLLSAVLAGVERVDSYAESLSVELPDTIGIDSDIALLDLQALASGDEFGRSDNLTIDDFTQYSYDIVSDAPSGAVITGAEFRFRVIHDFVQHLEISIHSPDGTERVMQRPERPKSLLTI